jgi:hypothetical protein
MEFCLIGLFFLVRDTKGHVACDAQGIIVAVVLVLTILYQIWLMNHLAPLFKYAPVRLEVESKALLADYQEKRETESGGTQEAPVSANFESRDDEKARMDLSGHTESRPQNIEAIHTPELSTQIRPPFWQRNSSHRSQNIQDQQREDEKSAERILARLNRPLDEARLAHLETKLAQKEAHIGNAPTATQRHRSTDAR